MFAADRLIWNTLFALRPPTPSVALVCASIGIALAGALLLTESGGTAASDSPVPIGWRLPAPLPKSLGQTFYVATDGSDSNPGTLSQPWRTVQHALDVLDPDQRALVREGAYSENLFMERDGTLSAPITIANHPGERVVLRPAGGHANNHVLVLYSVSYVRVHGFSIEGADGPSSAAVYFEADTHHVELSGNEIHDSATQGIFSAPTTHDLQILGNAIHDNGPTPSSQTHGIYLEGDDQLVANNLIYDNRYGFGVQVYPSANRDLIVDNTIVGNGISGIVIGAVGPTTVEYTTIVNNIVAFNESAGIQSYFPTGSIVGKGNAAYQNVGFGNPDGDFVTWEGDGIDYSGGNIVADPLFVDRGGGDFRLGDGSPAFDKGVFDYSHPFDYDGVMRP